MLEKKKLLALIDKGAIGGSRFHRLILQCQMLPKDKYEVHYLANNFLTEDLVKGYDYVLNAWIQLTKCSLLSIWREKYGFKYIQDMDDYWKLHYQHNQKGIVDKVQFQVEDQLILADTVLCATEFLREKILPYNENVFVRKNFLPINEFGFDVETKIIPEGQKINIGICGSSSHFSDWQSIKGQLEKIKNDTQIQDNCNFVVAGYHNEGKQRNNWDKIVDLFTYKRNGEIIRPIVLAHKPMKSIEGDPFRQEYINLYKDIDILLNPLIDNEWNNAKSELKCLECGIKSTLMLSGSMYKRMGINSYCIVEGEISYYKWIKRLISDRNLLNELKTKYQQELLFLSGQYRKEYSLEKWLI